MFNSKYVNIILEAIIIILITGQYVIYFYYKNPDIDNNIADIVTEEKINQEKDKNDIIENYYVEIKGAVKNPGVYNLTSNSIINDVVTLAGGFTKNAYTNNINLSMNIQKQMVIYVYTNSEYEKENKPIVKEIIKECICPSQDISTCIEQKESIIVSEYNEKEIENNIKEETITEEIKEESPNNIPEEKSSKININSASKEELTTLNGIGDAKAQSIIDYRNTNGNFTSIEDIKNVSGISETIYEKIKDNITV